MFTKKWPLFIILIILVLSSVVFALFYYQKQERITKMVVEQEEKTKPCPVKFTIIIDGVLEETKDSFLYIKPKGEEGRKSIDLTDETRFFEVYFSPGGTVTQVGQKEIKLKDLKVGDPLSVIASYEKELPDKYIALTVRRMIVKE